MKHELKIWPQYFCRVLDGSKTFEVRKNDRGFQPGDHVVLHEYDPNIEWEEDNGLPGLAGNWVRHKGKYSGRKATFRVGYVLPIDADRVVFSLLKFVTNDQAINYPDMVSKA
jgi:hypothetical protein